MIEQNYNFEWYLEAQAYSYSASFNEVKNGKEIMMVEQNYNLERYLEAQAYSYATALNEVKNGKKTSHWMWYIFPQLLGLGYSETSKFYAIKNLDEAKAYLDHPILGRRLKEITTVLLELDKGTAKQIFGSPDDLKLKSCMTLFAMVDGTEDNIFKQVITKYFDNRLDERTLRLINLSE